MIVKHKNKSFRILKIGEIIKNTDRAWCKEAELPKSFEMSFTKCAGLTVEARDYNFYYREIQPII